VNNPGDLGTSPSQQSEVSWLTKLSTQAKVGWQIFWGETRTRILVWYVLILTFAIGISIPLFRQLLFADIDARVRREMAEELEDFRNLLVSNYDFESHESNDYETDSQTIKINEINASHSAQITSRIPLSLKSLQAEAALKQLFVDTYLSHNVLEDGITPPTTEAALKQFFDAYMAHRIPDDDVYFIAFVGEQFYKSSPSGRPPDLGEDSFLIPDWAQQTQPEQGEQTSENPDVGSILYLVEPIQYQNQPLGVFVIAHTTAGERAEGLAATLIAGQVAVGVLLLALLLVWMASGRVLQPLQALATTVESVSESDLARRLPVKGKGELARLATQFNDMMNRVETAFVSQREFVNDAGHELRTPITIIRGHLEVMEADSLDQQETLVLVIDELDRMSRFVDDLILLAKAERPDFLHLETVDVSILTQELFAKAQALAPRKWRLEDVAQGQIVVDRQRITQAIMNLAHNATQYTKESDTITLGSAISKGKVHFWVQDTGEGIPLTDQVRIFERFARAAHQPRRSEGAGLGLSIVKAIAVAHGGEINLRSQYGKGSTFAIVLPLR
jgi:signal transduction histidine kinase